MRAVDVFACIACDYRRGHVMPELWSAKAIDSHLIPKAFEAEVAFTDDEQQLILHPGHKCPVVSNTGA